MATPKDPRKSTSLLAWLPAHGTPGQREAGRALIGAFAEYAASANGRTGKVRAALAEIAAHAERTYAARGERKASASADATPRKARKAERKPSTNGTPNGGKVAARNPATKTYACKPCARRVIENFRAAHEASAVHTANAKAYAARKR